MAYIMTNHVTNWGDWSDFEYCPRGFFVSGMQLKAEGQYVITVKEGPWGYWRRHVRCPGVAVVVSFRHRAEAPLGPRKDDTATNDVEIKCSDGKVFTGNGETYGDWQLRQSCPSGSAICGLSVQIEGSQGRKDDTALNNIKVACCTYTGPK
ncbi:putative Vitelline membrane outer layer protein 1-like protein [Hypsibius exemplaris]|uniref:Vitelline membrane outer layer protein 1-like protein n=1 Tax=Hypsibius exemplaris TaxID=2072580 RepID=A0A1W0W9X6_HYPEX|nr:putative Vitelline membrane outer layer protein 1-like protein [Hypsibius exemplaris]